MDKKLLTVTIGIPAHNEENNIGNLLHALLKQKATNFILEKIIVYSDASTDSTEKIVRGFKKPVQLLSGKKQIGQLQGINTILQNSNTDIVVLIDADVTVKKNTVISKLVEPFYQNSKIGLVGGNRKVFKAKTFIEEAIHTSIRAYDSIALHLNGGNNPYNCHGCILALSKKYYQSIDLPKQIFSGDTFLYFSCLDKKMLFKYAAGAEVYVYTANNLQDSIIQYKRFLAIDKFSEKKFKKFLNKEYTVPTMLKYKYLFSELLRKPLHTFTMFLIVQYCKRFRHTSEMKAIWSIAQSTKGIHES